jgi:hypothetical protein
MEALMKKIVLIATLAGAGLVAAAPPSHWRQSGEGGVAAGRGYPACSKTVTDRCIQLYERGVASRTNLALNERLGMPGSRPAMGGPYEAAPSGGAVVAAEPAPWPRTARSGYPACSRTVKDRCIQLYERGVNGRGN